MLKWGLILLVWLASGWSQPRYLLPSSDNRSRDEPIVQVSGKEQVGLGKLAIGAVATNSWNVKNKTDLDVELRVISSSCPCLKVGIEPRKVGPGGETVVDLATAVAPASGPQAHWALIEASSTDSHGGRVGTHRFKLGIEYEADLAFVVEPPRLWMVPVEGEEATRTIYVRSVALDALNIRDIRTEGEGLSVKDVRRFVVPGDVRPGEEALAITVAVKLRRPGLFEGKVLFRTDDHVFGDAWLPVQIRVRDAWVAEPAGFPIIFGAEPAPIHQTLRVFSRDGRVCPKLRAEVRDDPGSPAVGGAFQTELRPEQDAKGISVSVTADPSKLRGSEGLGSIDLIDDGGTVLKSIPFAWIKRKLAESPNSNAR